MADADAAGLVEEAVKLLEKAHGKLEQARKEVPDSETDTRHGEDLELLSAEVRDLTLQASLRVAALELQPPTPKLRRWTLRLPNSGAND